MPEPGEPADELGAAAPIQTSPADELSAVERARAESAVPEASAEEQALETPALETPDDDPATGESSTPDDVPRPEAWSLPDPVPVFRLVDVVDVAVALPSPYPTVTLREAEPPYRTLTIPVGMPEGTALAHALYKVATPRPLTHELVVEVLQRLNTDLAAVRLVGRFSGTYVAELDLVGVHGRAVVSCRPSDGLTLALRQSVPAPILADERLFASDGDVPESPEG